MTWFIVVVSLLIEMLLGNTAQLRSTQWINATETWLRGLVGEQPWWYGVVGLLLTIAVPVAAIGVVFSLLAATSPFIAMLAGIGVTLYCMGPRELDDDIDHALVSDNTAAAEALTSPLTLESDANINADDRAAAGVLVSAHDRILAPLFWVVLLGPMGAILFRAADILRGAPGEPPDSRAAAARRLYQLLAWLPSRALALSFGVAGSFTHTMNACRATDDFGLSDSQPVLVKAGLAAIEPDSRGPLDENTRQWTIRAVRGLVYRALTMWVVVFTVFSLVG